MYNPNLPVRYGGGQIQRSGGYEGEIVPQQPDWGNAGYGSLAVFGTLPLDNRLITVALQDNIYQSATQQIHKTSIDGEVRYMAYFSRLPVGNYTVKWRADWDHLMHVSVFPGLTNELFIGG